MNSKCNLPFKILPTKYKYLWSSIWSTCHGHYCTAAEGVAIGVTHSVLQQNTILYWVNDVLFV